MSSENPNAARGALPREVLAGLVAADLSVRAIAAEVDRSPATVRYWLRRHGLVTSAIARRPGPRSTRPQRVEQLCPVHGLGSFVARPDGRYACTKCRAGAVSDWRRRAKRLLVEEAGGGCFACGYDRCISALHFHHVDPAQKRFGLGSRGLARSIDTLREEARKCILLCSNCHAEVEAGLREVALD